MPEHLMTSPDYAPICESKKLLVEANSDGNKFLLASKRSTNIIITRVVASIFVARTKPKFCDTFIRNLAPLDFFGPKKCPFV